MEFIGPKKTTINIFLLYPICYPEIIILFKLYAAIVDAGVKNEDVLKNFISFSGEFQIQVSVCICKAANDSFSDNLSILFFAAIHSSYSRLKVQ